MILNNQKSLIEQSNADESKEVLTIDDFGIDLKLLCAYQDRLLKELSQTELNFPLLSVLVRGLVNGLFLT